MSVAYYKANPRYPPYLSHYGLKDQSWYEHKYGRWQDQAMYAIGKVNPDKKYHSKAEDYNLNNYYNGHLPKKVTFKEYLKLSKDEKKALNAAKNDFRIQMARRGSLTDMLMLSADARSILSTALLTHVGGSTTQMLVNKKRIKDYNRRYGDNATYEHLGSLKDRIASNDKEFNAYLDKSTIRRQNLSDDYVRMYSQEMYRLLANGRTQNKLDRLQNQNEVLKKINTTGNDFLDNLSALHISTSLINFAASQAIGYLSPTGTKSVLEGVIKYLKVDKIAHAKSKLPKDANGIPLKQAVMTADDDMKAVNPGYAGPFTWARGKSNTNCQMCSTAYELRRRGYDVIASNAKNPLDTGNVWDFFPNAKGTRYYADGMGVNLTKDDAFGVFKTGDHTSGRIPQSAVQKIINNIVKTQGNGARGYFNLCWDGNSGHSIAYEVSGGNLILRDSQIGQVISDPAEYITQAIGLDVIRVDNASFNINAIKSVLNPWLFK